MNLTEFSRRGGKARAAKLTPAQRKASAMKAAKAAGLVHAAKARKRRELAK